MSIPQPLRTEIMKIFFDESGDKSNRPALMGGVIDS